MSEAAHNAPTSTSAHFHTATGPAFTEMMNIPAPHTLPRDFAVKYNSLFIKPLGNLGYAYLRTRQYVFTWLAKHCGLQFFVKRRSNNELIGTFWGIPLIRTSSSGGLIRHLSAESVLTQGVPAFTTHRTAIIGRKLERHVRKWFVPIKQWTICRLLNNNKEPPDINSPKPWQTSYISIGEKHCIVWSGMPGHTMQYHTIQCNSRPGHSIRCAPSGSTQFHKIRLCKATCWHPNVYRFAIPRFGGIAFQQHIDCQTLAFYNKTDACKWFNYACLTSEHKIKTAKTPETPIGWLNSRKNSLIIEYPETRPKFTSPENKKNGLDQYFLFSPEGSLIAYRICLFGSTCNSVILQYPVKLKVAYQKTGCAEYVASGSLDIQGHLYKSTFYTFRKTCFLYRKYRNSQQAAM